MFSQGFGSCSSTVLRLFSTAFFAVPLYYIKATETLYLILRKHSKMSKFLSPKGEQGKAKPFTNSNRNDLIKHHCPNTSALQTDQVVKDWIKVLVSILSPPKGFCLRLKLKLMFFTEFTCFRRKGKHSKQITLKTKNYGLNNAISIGHSLKYKISDTERPFKCSHWFSPLILVSLRYPLHPYSCLFI